MCSSTFTFYALGQPAILGQIMEYVHISGKNHCLRPAEGLLEVEFAAVCDGEKSKRYI